MYHKISKCRICGNTELIPIIDLGEQALTGVFPRSVDDQVGYSPIELVKCSEDADGRHCGLVQLSHSYSLGEMYGENYGYRSGLNQSMVKHLSNKVKKIMETVKLNKDDVVIDIGSNDSTLLRQYGNSFGCRLLGIDPTGVKFKEYYPDYIDLIPDFFTAEKAKKVIGDQKAKVVTSIAMFYDLEDPLDFVKDIYEVLDSDGIWVFEQSYLPLMIETCSYDTACHEHLEYYRLKQIKWMLDKVGFRIIDIEFNNINGGSFSITAAKKESSYSSDEKVQVILDQEYTDNYHTMKPYQDFAEKVAANREQLMDFLRKEKEAGKLILGYGASTKGNVLLQYCGITTAEIPFIAEVNEDKFGCFTPHTHIPIISEKEAKAMKPDYFIVLPWHFKDFIIKKEQEYLDFGGKFIFPLPEFTVYSKK